MRDISIFDSSLKYHKEYLRFYFMEIIQKKLNETRRLWNNHRIRYNRNSECPTDRPDVLYFNPELFSGRNCRYEVSTFHTDTAKEQCMAPLFLECSEDFINLATLIMQENQKTVMQENQESVTEARNLYEMLLQEIENFLSL